MGTSRTVAWGLIVSVCCLSSMLAVTALSDTRPAVPLATPPSVTEPPTPGPPKPPPAYRDPYAPPPRSPYPPRHPAPLEPGKARVTLKDGSFLLGEIVGMERVTIETQYGDFSIPAKQVLCIRWSGAPEKTSVEMRGGDRLTGRLDAATLKLKALWGEVSLDMEHVVRVSWGGPLVPYGAYLSPAPSIAAPKWDPFWAPESQSDQIGRQFPKPGR